MPSLADEYIAQLIDERSRVEVFLLHGICLRGVIDGHDKDAITLRSSNRAKDKQLVFKHGISAIQRELGRRSARLRPAPNPDKPRLEDASVEQDGNHEFGNNRNR